MRGAAVAVESQEMCRYGCGCIAKFATVSGKLMCAPSPSQCPANRKKNSLALQKCYENGRDGKAIASRRVYSAEARARQGWAAGQTQESNPSIKKVADSLRGVSRKGTPRSPELRRRDSANRVRTLECSPHVKWLMLPTGLKVQGSWEYNVGLRLLALGFELSRPRLAYDSVRTYTPDFCLGDGTYVEVKGWLSRRDVLKYAKFFGEHPDVSITLIRNEGGINNYSRFVAGEISLSACEDLQTVVRQYLAEPGSLGSA